MSPYIAIAKRDFSQNKWNYVLFLAIAFSVLDYSSELTLSQFATENNTFSLHQVAFGWVLTFAFFPLYILGVQYSSLRAMFSHSLAFSLPNMRKFQYICSLCLYFVVTLSVVVTGANTFGQTLTYFVLLFSIGAFAMLALTLDNRVLVNLVNFVVIGLFIALVVTDFGKWMFLTTQAIDRLSTAAQLAVLVISMGVSAWLYIIAYHMYMKPKELDENRLPLGWSSKTKGLIPANFTNSELSTRSTDSLYKNMARSI